jgi:A/G-specific adenine glycosylase
LSHECKALATDQPENYPVKEPRKQKPTRYGVAFWTESPSGAVLLRRRQNKGLLGGMMEIPTTPWREDAWTVTESLSEAPKKARWRLLPGTVRHTFTHFHLELQVLAGQVQNVGSVDGVWCAVDKLHEHALPTVMKKVARHAASARSERTP